MIAELFCSADFAYLVIYGIISLANVMLDDEEWKWMAADQNTREEGSDIGSPKGVIRSCH